MVLWHELLYQKEFSQSCAVTPDEVIAFVGVTVRVTAETFRKSTTETLSNWQKILQVFVFKALRVFLIISEKSGGGGGVYITLFLKSYYCWIYVL